MIANQGNRTSDRQHRTGYRHVLIGARIEELREARGWSRVDLAERAGIGKKAVESAEKGLGLPALVLLDVARALGLTVAELVPPEAA